MDKLEIVLGREIELAKILLRKLIALSSSKKTVHMWDLLYAAKDDLVAVENMDWYRFGYRRHPPDYYFVLDQLKLAGYIVVSGTPFKLVRPDAELSMSEDAKKFFKEIYKPQE